MASETKVGVVAGLAFIICFAVILANRGRQTVTDAPASYLSAEDAPVPYQSGMRPSGVDNSRKTTVAAVRGHETPAPPAGAAPRPIPWRVDLAPPSGDEV